MAETRLETATRHVAEGAKIIARQRALISKLRWSGHDARWAEELLERFETCQRIFKKHRLSLLKEIGFLIASDRRDQEKAPHG